MNNVVAWVLEWLWKIGCDESWTPVHDEPELPQEQQFELGITQLAASRERAALWVGLVCGDKHIDIREADSDGPWLTVTHPYQQWTLVYRGTALESLN